jgi:Ca2+-binding EF-hand superfamily protein
MADIRRSGEVKFSAILEALNKILPHLTQDFLEQVPTAFEMNYNEILTPDDFNMIFDRKAAHTAPNTVPKPSAKKVANQKKAYENNEDYTAILKYLAQEIQKNNDTPQRFFK